MDSTLAQTWIGIDVSKDKLDCCLLRASGKPIYDIFTNDQDGHSKLLQWARKQSTNRVVHFCMEATGTYHLSFATYLAFAGELVSVVNPTKIKYSTDEGSKNQDDRACALKIASFARLHHPDAWECPSDEKRLLHELSRFHVTLIKELAKCDTRLKTPELVPQVRQLLEESRQLLTKQIADIEKQINDHIDKNGDLKDDIDLVESIPGIGKPTAQRIIAEMPIFVPKQNGSSFAAYAGLAPRVRQSGSSIRRTTHLSKCGNSRLRAALYWPAITAIKCNEVIKTFAKRLAEKGKSKMSIIGAVMRKLLILAYGVLKTRQPFDCQFKNNKTFAAIS